MSSDDGGLTPELLRRAEEQLGMTQKQLAAIAGVPPRTYRGWRSGAHAPSASKRGALLRYLREHDVTVVTDAPPLTGLRKAALAALAHVPDEKLLDAIRALNDIAEDRTESDGDGS